MSIENNFSGAGLIQDTSVMVNPRKIGWLGKGQYIVESTGVDSTCLVLSSVNFVKQSEYSALYPVVPRMANTSRAHWLSLSWIHPFTLLPDLRTTWASWKVNPMAPCDSSGQVRRLQEIDVPRSPFLQGCMPSTCIVPVQKAADIPLRLPHRFGLMKVDMLVLERPPEPLHDDIVDGSSAAVPIQIISMITNIYIPIWFQLQSGIFLLQRAVAEFVKNPDSSI